MTTQPKELYDAFRSLKKWNKNIEIKISDHEMNGMTAISELETLQMKIKGKIYFHQVLNICRPVMFVLLGSFGGQNVKFGNIFSPDYSKMALEYPKMMDISTF